MDIIKNNKNVNLNPNNIYMCVCVCVCCNSYNERKLFYMKKKNLSPKCL